MSAKLVREIAETLADQGMNGAVQTLKEAAKVLDDYERAFQMLDSYSIPRDRARTVSNGIMVLATRMQREVNDLQGAIRRASETPTRTVPSGSRVFSTETGEEFIRGMLGHPDNDMGM